MNVDFPKLLGAFLGGALLAVTLGGFTLWKDVAVLQSDIRTFISDTKDKLIDHEYRIRSVEGEAGIRNSPLTRSPR